MSFAPRIDAVTEKIHRLFLPYWPPIYANLIQSMLHLDRPERQEQLFSALSFPFHPLPVPSFELVVNWNLDELIGALATSSAAQTCLASADQPRLVALFEDVAKVWGEPTERKTGVETRTRAAKRAIGCWRHSVNTRRSICRTHPKCPRCAANMSSTL
jgi:hypothetical protein